MQRSLAKSNYFDEQNERIQFDLPSVLAADAIPGRPNELTVKVQLSAVIHPDQESQSRHWRLAVKPRDPWTKIIDYSPKTEMGCETVGSIETKTSEESTSSLGLGLSVDYAKLINLHSTSDQSTKELHSRQYQAKAIQQAKIASGSIDRGSGVHFKLARTSDQILDGEKTFEFTLLVNEGWRCGLLDLTVIALGTRRKFDIRTATWRSSSKSLKTQTFVIALYRKNDMVAEKLAKTLASQEQTLRSMRTKADHPNSDHFVSRFLNDLGEKLEETFANETENDWLDRVIHQQIDPHNDHELKNLNAETRVAILDYLSSKDSFLNLNRTQDDCQSSSSQ